MERVAVIGLVALRAPVENESGSRTVVNAVSRAIFLILIPAAAVSATEPVSGDASIVEERADRLSMYATLFDDPSLINEMLGRYLAVTPEAILEVAAATFRPDNRLVLTYLPEMPPADSEAIDSDAENDAEQDEEVAA
jgi:hypothetical protein